MFSLEGPARKPGQNRALAAFLSVIAGYVNAAGFILVGSFTSHVTGSAGRFANNLVERDYFDAVSALLLVLAFFLGAFSANVLLLTKLLSRRPLVYAGLLALEASLLLAFIVIIDFKIAENASRSADAKAAILCFCMGLQNSLVTVISEARVRTTHLTGVVTDLGIEAARWLRYALGKLRARADIEKPVAATTQLLLTILFGFLFGAAGGAELTRVYRANAMAAPAAAAFFAAAFAAWTGTRISRSTTKP